jgi:predicted metalloprotease
VTTATGRTASLCLAGAWAANIGSETGNGSSTLSPGDLDEGVAALVASRSGTVDRGCAFDRVAAFRTGFHDGPSSCVTSTSSKSTGSKNVPTTSGKTATTKV